MKPVQSAGSRRKIALLLSSVLLMVISLALVVDLLITYPLPPLSKGDLTPIAAIERLSPSETQVMQVANLDKKTLDILLYPSKTESYSFDFLSKKSSNNSIIFISILIFMISCAMVLMLNQTDTVLTRADRGPLDFGRKDSPRKRDVPMAETSKPTIHYTNPKTGYQSEMTDEESKAFLIKAGILNPDGSLAKGISADKINFENPSK